MVGGLILLIIAGLVARVVDLTVINRIFLQHQGDVRVLRTLNMPAFRGMITDRNGYPLAVSTTVYSVWMNPQDFLATPENVDLLSRTLSVNSGSILTQLANPKLRTREFIYVKRGVQPELADQVKKLELPGIYLQEEYKRYYPEGEVSSHLIGFTNIDDKGQEGLELLYNDWLTGTRGIKRVVKDRLGRSVSDVKMIQEQHPGKDLALSMDRRIQYLAYRELMAGIKESVAISGSVVVLDVQTGEVLAMVNQPSYNPNNRMELQRDVYRNRAVTDSFEPGSTIKAFSISQCAG